MTTNHVADTETITGVSLFSGVGMLDEAVGLALARRRVSHRVAAYCEWEACAASTLLARMEEQSLEPCPVWCGDLADFPAESFAGRIDIVTAGYPCQPFSVAGKKRGLADTRAMGEDGDGPIGQMLQIIGAVQPRFVFLENVGASLQHFRPIGRELEKLGYEVAPPLFLAAEDVGATHKRERIFILAQLADEPSSGRTGSGLSGAAGRQHFAGAERSGEELANCEGDEQWRDTKSSSDRQGKQAGGCGGELGDAQDKRHERCSRTGRKAGSRSEYGSAELANSQRESRSTEQFDQTGKRRASEKENGLQRQQQTGTEEMAIGRSGRATLFAPGPGDRAEWERALADAPHLAPAIEPEVRLLADGVAYVVDASRADQLRCCGNGVVALQGAVAFEFLLREFE